MIENFTLFSNFPLANICKVMLTTHIHIVSSLKMNGTTRIYLLPLYVFLTSTGKILMILPYVILLVIATA